MTRISDMTPLTSLPATGAYVPVEKTGSTTNYRYDLSTLANLNVLFVNASSLIIPTDIFVISTTGYSTLDKGGANYVYDIAVDAAYVTAHPRASFISANARGFRLSADQVITPQIFGALADGSTDDSAAFLAAIAHLKAAAISGYGYANLGASKLFIPAGVYYLGTTTLDLDFGVIIEGESVGGVGPGSTVLKWANGTTGIRTQYNDTTGATGTKTPVSNYGISSLKNLLLYGSYTSGAESEAYGIHARSHMTAEDVGIFNFAGDGVYQRNTAGGSPDGNSNVSFFKNVFVQGCRNGFYADGADTNASTFIACNASVNRQWGFWDSSFIGNTYLGCHTAANGWDGAITSIPTGSTLNNIRFYVKPGQATGASTNTPKSSTVTITIASPGVVTWNAHGLSDGTAVMFGTTGALPTGLSAGTVYYVVSGAANSFSVSATVGGTAINTSGSQSGTHGAGSDNTYWGVNSNGGIFNGIVAWLSGTTFREGGSYKCDEASAVNQVIACYSETDQNPPQVAGPSVVWGGVVGETNKGNGPTISSSSGELTLSAGILTQGQIGSFGSTVGTEIAIYAVAASGGRYIARNYHEFYAGGGRVHYTSSTGLNFDSGKVIVMNGTTALDGSRNATLAAVTSTSMAATGAITSSGGGIGYATGAGGTITQATSRTTGVTLNKLSGAITLFSAAGSATYQTFTVTNSQVAATDVVHVTQKSGADKNIILVTAVGAGTFDITFATTGGTTTEQPVFNFAVVKAVAA